MTTSVLAPIKFSLVAVRGDTLEIDCTVTTPAGGAFDLTNWTITSQLRAQRNDDIPTETFAVINRDNAAGTFTLRLDPAETVNLDTTYQCDVELSSVTDTHTWADGTIRFAPDVSR